MGSNRVFQVHENLPFSKLKEALTIIVSLIDTLQEMGYQERNISIFNVFSADSMGMILLYGNMRITLIDHVIGLDCCAVSIPTQCFAYSESDVFITTAVKHFSSCKRCNYRAQ